MPLTSVQNQRIQEIRKAAHAGRPTPDGLIVAEGPHLLEEARGSRWKVENIFCTAAAEARFSRLLGEADAPVTELTPRVFASLSTTESTQGILLLLRPRTWTWKEVTCGRALTVVLDGIQDPGNVGTIVRSAEAFGASGVVLSEGCAKISNGKVLRGAAGSLFCLPVLEGVSRGEIGAQLNAAKLRVYALAADGAIGLADAGLRQPMALVVGSEGAGLSPELLALAETLKIPTARVESLNAAVACSVALFEAARQRSLP